jgi:hypothetical protein
MKPQPKTIPRGLLRPKTSCSPDAAKVTIGPKSEISPPAIKVNRSAQGVESIEVVCSCGERIVIRCEYE